MGRDTVTLADGRTVSIRPVESGDAAAIQSFIGSLSTSSRYERFFLAYRELPPDALDRIVGADQEKDVVLLALATLLDGSAEVVGLAQYAGESPAAEVAVVVGENWRRAGLATRMLQALAVIAVDHGVVRVQAEILRYNGAAIGLATKFEAKVGPSPGSPNLVRVSKQFFAAPVPAAAGTTSSHL